LTNTTLRHIISYLYFHVGPPIVLFQILVYFNTTRMYREFRLVCLLQDLLFNNRIVRHIHTSSHHLQFEKGFQFRYLLYFSYLTLHHLLVVLIIFVLDTSVVLLVMLLTFLLNSCSTGPLIFSTLLVFVHPILVVCSEPLCFCNKECRLPYSFRDGIL
jgi:hypothetical protein